MTIILITIGCFTGFAFIPKVLGNVNLNDNNTIDVDYPNIVWCNDNEVSYDSESQSNNCLFQFIFLVHRKQRFLWKFSSNGL